nr:cache domain-containing protein [Clostridia bacterium]
MQDKNRMAWPPFKSSVFIRYMLSFMAVLIIPLLLVIAFIYNHLETSLIRSVHDTTLYALTHASESFEQKTYELEYIASTVPSNKDIMSLFRYSGRQQDTLPVELYRGYRQLVAYTELNSSLDNISVYLGNINTIISTYGKNDIQDYFQLQYAQPNYNASDFEQYVEAVLQSMEPRLYVVRFAGEGGRAILLYIKPLYENAGMIMNMNLSSINGLLNRALGSYGGSVYMLDENGRIVTSVSRGNGTKYGEQKLATFIADKGAAFSEILQAENLHVSYLKSIQTGYAFLS